MMVESRKNGNDRSKAFAALMMDLSKVFVRLSHDSLVAKLNAYSI